MHPILFDRKKLAFFLIAWLIIGLLFSALLATPGTIDWGSALILALPLTLLYEFICLSGWYLCRVFPWNATNRFKLMFIFLLSGSLSSSLWVLAGQGWYSILSQISVLSGSTGAVMIDSRLLFGFGVVLYLLAVAMQYLMIASEETSKAEQSALELRLLAQEAELKALRAQIDPHFLFNSLNSISALTTKNPEAARSMTVMLAEFFRKSLALGVEESITLLQEIELAMSFLSIERVRFADRLKIEQTIDEDAKNCLVPPLILQPLVENAVNHGIVHLVEGGTIRVQAQRAGSRLRLTVENPYDPETPRQSRSGLGLKNIRSRLHTLYNTDARLDVTEQGGQFRAELSLPAEE